MGLCSSQVPLQGVGACEGPWELSCEGSKECP